MKWFRVDASLVCFAVVMLAAIPVAALRAKTYSVGYDLGKLKESERALRQRNVELQVELASTQRSVRERFLKKSGTENGRLKLPETNSVLYSGVPQETEKGKASGRKQ